MNCTNFLPTSTLSVCCVLLRIQSCGRSALFILLVSYTWHVQLLGRQTLLFQNSRELICKETPLHVRSWAHRSFCSKTVGVMRGRARNISPIYQAVIYLQTVFFFFSETFALCYSMSNNRDRKLHRQSWRIRGFLGGELRGLTLAQIELYILVFSPSALNLPRVFGGFDSQTTTKFSELVTKTRFASRNIHVSGEKRKKRLRGKSWILTTYSEFSRHTRLLQLFFHLLVDVGRDCCFMLCYLNWLCHIRTHCNGVMVSALRF